MIFPLSSRWLAALACTLLSGCGPFLDDMAERRAAYAEGGEGPIVVAVVDNWPDGSYLNGLRLGVEQINASEDLLLGRPVELLVRPGEDEFRKVLPTVRSIAANPTVTAVLGHRTSAVAVPASITYEKARVLFMPPFATSKQLTLHGFDFVLRMLPDDKTMAAQVASLSSLFGYKRIAVLHGRSDSSRAVAFLFEDAARRFDIDIVFRGSFFADRDNYRELIGQLKGLEFDAIFLSTDTTSGARMLRQLRELGVEKPVLGSDSLGSGPLNELAGDAGDRTIVPTVFSPETTNAAKRRFIDDYRNAYGKKPNQAAAQGYDSIKILATIVERSGTTEASALSTTAHFTPPMAGITGIYAYDPDGNIFGKSYRFKVLRFGRWWSLPGVTVPYLLARFEEVLSQSTTAEQGAAPPQANPPEPASAPKASDPTVASGGEPGTTNQAGKPQGEAADSPKEASDPSAGDAADLATLTRVRMGSTERDQTWFALAHDLLEFDRLGLVISPGLAHDAALVGLARSVARMRGFEVETCDLPMARTEPEPAEPKLAEPKLAEQKSEKPDDPKNPDASTDPGEEARIALEQATLSCYSHLARTVDSLFVVTDTGLSPSYLKQLNRALLHFGVSSFILQENLEHDYGVTLALTSAGLDLQDPNVALRFNGLLNGLRVHELNRKISHLPAVLVDLKAARSLGLFTDPRELTLISGVLDESSPQPDISMAEETN